MVTSYPTTSEFRTAQACAVQTPGRLAGGSLLPTRLPQAKSSRTRQPRSASLMVEANQRDTGRSSTTDTAGNRSNIFQQAAECIHDVRGNDLFVAFCESGKRAVSSLTAATLALSMIAADTAPSDALAATQRPASVNKSVELYKTKQAPDTPTYMLTGEEAKTVNLFKSTTPSVVYITNLAVRRDAFTLDVLEVPQGTGSGFVWDDKGHIVTNFHVIKGASDVMVTVLDQGELPAAIVGFDQDKDVAVLKIDKTKLNKPEELRPLTVGQSTSLQVGQRVFAIGNPFGLDHTLTTGIISGLNREISSGNTGRPIQNVIQTDAAINPGNSGGPLLNSMGKVIGINTAIYSSSGTSSGVGFAIPSDTVVGIVDQIINYGRVTRPIIGISFAPDQSMELLGVKGVLVLGTPMGGPANLAGIRPTTRDETGRLLLGDIVVKIDGIGVENSSDLYRILDKSQVGQTLEVTVLRGDQEMTLPVTLMDQNGGQSLAQLMPQLLEQGRE